MKSFTLARKCATGFVLPEWGINRTVSCLPTALNRLYCLVFASRICEPWFSFLSISFRTNTQYKYLGLIQHTTTVVRKIFTIPGLWSPPHCRWHVQGSSYLLLMDADVMFFVCFSRCLPHRSRALNVGRKCGRRRTALLASKKFAWSGHPTNILLTSYGWIDTTVSGYQPSSTPSGNTTSTTLSRTWQRRRSRRPRECLGNRSYSSWSDGIHSSIIRHGCAN